MFENVISFKKAPNFTIIKTSKKQVVKNLVFLLNRHNNIIKTISHRDRPWLDAVCRVTPPLHSPQWSHTKEINKYTQRRQDKWNNLHGLRMETIHIPILVVSGSVVLKWNGGLSRNLVCTCNTNKKN